MAAASPQYSFRRALRAASGLAVLPSLWVADRLGLGSGTAFWVLSAIGWLVLSAGFGGWFFRRGSPLAWWLGQAVAGIALALGLSAFHALAPGSGARVPEVYRTLAYDLDAGIALDPQLECESELREGPVLASPGAHPRFGAPEDRLWFDAPGPERRRQLHFIDSGGEVKCWTCGEPGNNFRPAPNPQGQGVLFESDRDGGPGLFVAETRERPRGRLPSRRIIPGSAPGAFPIYEASGRGILWSTGEHGRFTVLAAALVTGHGGLILGTNRPLVAGGVAWVAPLAWSRDARSLVYAHGAGPDAYEGWWLDPATGEEKSLGPMAGSAAASFSRDGRLMVVSSEPGRDAGSAGLGFVLARIGGGAERVAGRSQLRIGTPGGELVPIGLGAVAAWGAPTGVALAADGRSIVLGQWRLGSDGREERLIRLLRSCRPPL